MKTEGVTVKVLRVIMSPKTNESSRHFAVFILHLIFPDETYTDTTLRALETKKFIPNFRIKSFEDGVCKPFSIVVLYLILAYVKSCVMNMT